MKRLFCTLLLSGIVTLSFAQNNTLVKMKMKTATREGTPSSNSFTWNPSIGNQQHGSSRTVTSVQLGSSGNLFTIFDGNINRLAADNTLNTVVFIHRSTDDATHNRGQYRYDASIDGGGTWVLNNGVLNPSGNQQTMAGRFPNVAIYNPAGNTDPDNAYMTYIGSWLPFDLMGSWDGQFSGVARLDNDTSTFTENISTPNNSEIDVIAGLCNGTPGVFWGVNWQTYEVSTTTLDHQAILVFKGLWNSADNDVDWALEDTITPPFDRDFDGVSRASSLNMSFDPTGQYGWITFLGDVDSGGYYVLTPVFYSTDDGGNSWNGPISVKLDTFTNILNGLVISPIPTTAFDLDIVTDIKGNPHVAVVIGSGSETAGSEYALTTGVATGLKIYDITYYRSANAACSGWQAILLDTVSTFRGVMATSTSGDITEDNRPQASRSPDGEKVFLSWLDSDPNVTPDNNLPNLKMRGLDITTGLATPIVNWTIDDIYFSGGALYASIAPSTFEASGIYSVPVVFAQVNTSGSAEDPASFVYVQGVQYAESDFTIDIVPNDFSNPTITLVGANPFYVYLGTSFADPGATAYDCVDGDLTDSIDVTDNVNAAVRGSYAATYTVTDLEGNSGNADRTVIVNTEPDANFIFTVNGPSVHFIDSSLYNPTTWSWDFDDGGGNSQQNPTHVYTATGTYHVCLRASNAFNTLFSKPIDELCKDVVVTSLVGIEDVVAENAFDVYPNPTDGLLTVEIKSASFESVRVEVLNLVGKKLTSFDLAERSAGSKQVLDLSGYAQGVYFIKIQTEQGQALRKVVLGM